MNQDTNPAISAQQAATDIEQTGTQRHASSDTETKAAGTDRKVAIAAYALMMAGPLLWLTPLIAVVIAYVQRGEASSMVRSHYGNILKCFWWSLIFMVVYTVVFLGLFTLMLSGAGYGANILLSAVALAFGIWIY